MKRYSAQINYDEQPFAPELVGDAQGEAVMFDDAMEEIERLRTDLERCHNVLVRLTGERNRLSAELADRERYWKQVGRNYETTRAAMQQIIDAQQQQIAAQQQLAAMAGGAK